MYCEESSSASHARLWVCWRFPLWEYRDLVADDRGTQVMIIEILSLVTAMMCLLQFYQQTKKELAAHQPLLKFLAIKLVVFLFYVQSVSKSPANSFLHSSLPTGSRR